MVGKDSTLSSVYFQVLYVRFRFHDNYYNYLGENL